MFSSIQQQLGAYKLAKKNSLHQQKNSAEELPLPSYSFTQQLPTTRTISVPSTMQITFSPQRVSTALPVRYEQTPLSPRPPMISMPYPQGIIPNTVPIQRAMPLPSAYSPTHNNPPLRSRSSARKHAIFNDQISRSGVRSVSRKKMPQISNIPINRARMDSQLFSQSVGSNRFYNHTEEKTREQKMRFPNSPRYEDPWRTKQNPYQSSVNSLDSSQINQLEKLSSKEVESRLVQEKQQLGTSPSDNTENSKKLKIPKFLRRLQSKDYNELASPEIDKPPNRFFDTEKSNFGQRQPSKQTIYLNKDFNRLSQVKSSNNLQNSLEDMLVKLDTRSKIIAMLVILMVLSLVIFEIVR